MATKNLRNKTIQRVENTVLIWLDDSIEETSNDFKNKQLQLRRVVNSINLFKTEEACIQFVNEETEEKLIIIVSGSLGPTFVPRVHNTSQVNAIFMFYQNGENYEDDWMRIWAKIRGQFTNIESLCQALSKTKTTCEQNCLSFTLTRTESESSENFDQLEPNFMYAQLMKENILSIKFDRTYLDQYLKYCHTAFVDNETELDNIKDMAENYYSKSPIWWYTKESFLYPMLNRALRLTQMNIILKIAFFIKDLHQELENLHRKEFPRTSNMKSFTVYRGQCLSEDGLEQIRQTKGGLIAFTNFLSTSKQREVSVGFALSSLQRNPTTVGILYVMDIHPRKATTSFASIESVSAVKGEEEVLFSMNAVFRIKDITRSEEHDRLFQVNLTLTDEDDKNLRKLTNYIRGKNYPTKEPWFRLGFLVKEMGHFDEAKDIFQTLLNQTTNAEDKSAAYFEIAAAHRANGDLKAALAAYAQNLLIERKLFSADHPCFASTYHNIGQVYYDLGDYSKALDYYKKALEIRKKSLPSNHPDLGVSYNNIAGVYEKMHDNKGFLEYSQKALKIGKQSLPSIDPNLGKLYGNIGLQRYNMGDYSNAMEYYKRALDIQRKSLPPDHPDLAMCYNNIAGVYQALGDIERALEYMEKSHDIRKQLLTPDHPELGMSYNNIGYLHEKTGDYSKARSYYKIAVSIAEKSLPFHHPHRQIWMQNHWRVNNR